MEKPEVYWDVLIVFDDLPGFDPLHHIAWTEEGAAEIKAEHEAISRAVGIRTTVTVTKVEVAEDPEL